MPRAYSEDTLVEQPAIELLAGLGWQTIGAFDEVFGSQTRTKAMKRVRFPVRVKRGSSVVSIYKTPSRG